MNQTAKVGEAFDPRIEQTDIYTGLVNKSEYGFDTFSKDMGVYPQNFLNSRIKCDWSA